MHGASDCTWADRVQLATQAAGDCPCRPQSDASSPDTRQARLSLRSSRTCNRPLNMHPSTTIVDGDAVAWGQRLYASISRTARYSGGRRLSMPTPKRCKLARYAAGSPKLAFLPLVQPLGHASTTISYRHPIDPDAVACGQRVNASRSRTARYSGGRSLPMPTPKRCKLA